MTTNKKTKNMPLFTFSDNNNQQWELAKEIGKGGTGIVYKTRPINTGRFNFVVKMDLYKRDTSRRTYNEIKAYQKIHKYIHKYENLTLIRNITSYGTIYGNKNNIFNQSTHCTIPYDFFIMPRYVTCMFDKVNNLRVNNDIIPFSVLIQYTKQLIMGIDFLQNHIKTHGILHRDIKSENLMLDSKNNLVLIDFGLAISLTEKRLQDNNRKYSDYMASMAVSRNIKSLHDQIKDINVINGTLEFAGYDAHLKMNTPRMDFESVLYLLFEWCLGAGFHLPWVYIKPEFIAIEKYLSREQKYNNIISLFDERYVPICKHVKKIINWFLTLKYSTIHIDYEPIIEYLDKLSIQENATIIS